MRGLRRIRPWSSNHVYTSLIVFVNSFFFFLLGIFSKRWMSHAPDRAEHDDDTEYDEQERSSNLWLLPERCEF